MCGMLPIAVGKPPGLNVLSVLFAPSPVREFQSKYRECSAVITFTHYSELSAYFRYLPIRTASSSFIRSGISPGGVTMPVLRA